MLHETPRNARKGTPVADVITDYNDGADIRLLARTYGTTTQNIRQLLQARGVYRGPRPEPLAAAEAPLKQPEQPAPAPAAPESVSLKSRLLRAIAEAGPFESVDALLGAIRTPADSFAPHETTHVLYSLQKQGLIAFRKVRRPTSAKGGGPIADITATSRGYQAAGVPIPRKTPPTPEVYPVERRFVEPAPAAPTPPDEPQRRVVSTLPPPPVRTEVRRYPDEDTGEIIGSRVTVREPAPAAEDVPPLPSWPVLTALRAAAAEEAGSRARAARLLEAAALIDADEPEEAARLLARAEAIVGKPYLTDAEREYIAYAEAHGDA